MAQQEYLKVKLLSRILVKGVGQKVGSEHELKKSEALRLIHAGKATADLEAKTDPDPTETGKSGK